MSVLRKVIVAGATIGVFGAFYDVVTYLWNDRPLTVVVIGFGFLNLLVDWYKEFVTLDKSS